MDWFRLLAAGGPPIENLSIFDPASPSGAWIRHLFILVLVVTGAIFLLVEGVLIYSLIRFRSGNATSEPPQVYGSQPIEIAWTAAPTLIVFLLVLVFIRTEYEVRVEPTKPPPGSQPLYVTVIGHQWWWEYIYDTYDGEKLGFHTANELHIPASDAAVPRPVYLTLKSADVCHSYWVPRLAGKTDLIPGRVNQMWLQTEQTGLFLGQCAEFCGTQHANMLLRVVVDTPEEFQKWRVNEGRPPVAEAAPAVQAGKALFLSQSCINCHRVLGTSAQGMHAPDLTHLMSRKTLASGMIENTRENLRRWIVDPQKVKPGCLMPAFQLNDRDVDQIVDYLTTLR